MSDQFNISGFPKLLRLKLAHLALDAGKKLNQYIIHICWEHVREKGKPQSPQTISEFVGMPDGKMSIPEFIKWNGGKIKKEEMK